MSESTSNIQSLKPYACHPTDSSGRLYEEEESKTRTCFQRDKDRIIHSSAFRRLEYKTQVFVNHEGDFFRTRLTHSLEVSQITRSICRFLGLNEDLGEALALAHDLGHPPFGHAGEEALQVTMKPFGGFDHNAQSLRIITRLEKCYGDFDGLNLTWETLEGVVKHNGPLVGKHAGDIPVSRGILEYNRKHDLQLASFASAEAQIAAISDDIAYNNHDLDDGLRAKLFSVEDLKDVPLAGPVFFDVRATYPDINESRLIHEAIRRMIGMMVEDLLKETASRIADLKPRFASDIRTCSSSVASFSEKMQKNDKSLKQFLHENMYRHYKLNRMTSKAKRVVTELARFLLKEPECLPTEWQPQGDHMVDKEELAQQVTDYVASMTDRCALDEYHLLFDIDARTS